LAFFFYGTQTTSKMAGPLAFGWVKFLLSSLPSHNTEEDLNALAGRKNEEMPWIQLFIWWCIAKFLNFPGWSLGGYRFDWFNLFLGVWFSCLFGSVTDLLHMFGYLYAPVTDGLCLLFLIDYHGLRTPGVIFSSFSFTAQTRTPKEDLFEICNEKTCPRAATSL
jgi:hypothetical protein